MFFRFVFPQAECHQTEIPTALVELLLGAHPDTANQDVEHYFSRGLATATRKTYQAGQRHYLEFCEQATIPPLLALKSKLCRFVTVLANNGIAHSTIKVYLSATRQLHITKGLPEPRMEKMPRLSQVLRGIRTTQPTKVYEAADNPCMEFCYGLKKTGKRTGG